MEAYLPSINGINSNDTVKQECSTCNGTGQVMTRPATPEYPAEGTECPDCNGEGEYEVG